LRAKYLTSKDYYNVKIINDIIYNEPTNVVSVFKDYLIYDDVSEFLKRPYTGEEAKARLPKIFDFYEKYSKVFPNYVVLPESKFMFKNIERKQRLIDEKQKYMVDKQGRSKPAGSQKATDNSRLFNTRFVESVLNNHNPSMVSEANSFESSRFGSRILEYK